MAAEALDTKASGQKPNRPLFQQNRVKMRVGYISAQHFSIDLRLITSFKGNLHNYSYLLLYFSFKCFIQAFD